MRPQIYEKDGVNYLIRARKAGLGYLATWTCDECGVTGGFDEASKTEEEAIDTAKVNLSTHHKLKHPSRAASPRGISRRAIIAVGVIGVLSAAIVYVVMCVDFNDWWAIQGEWRDVSNASEWSFGDNGLADTPFGRDHYSINPVLHTIKWGDSRSWEWDTYELNGDRLKIWAHGGNSKALYVLKRVGSD